MPTLLARMARRHAFWHQYQNKGESVSQYMAALRQAALYCEFSDLDDILLDQLISGVRDIKLQPVIQDFYP